MSLDSTHQFNIPTPARVGEIFKNPSPIDRSIGGDGDDGGLIDPFFILPLPSSPYTYASPPSLASIKLINHTWLTPILQPPGFFFFFFPPPPLFSCSSSDFALGVLSTQPLGKNDEDRARTWILAQTSSEFFASFVYATFILLQTESMDTIYDRFHPYHCSPSTSP